MESIVVCLVLCLSNLSLAQNIANEEVSLPAYTKQEVRIEMRDGVTLHTTIYSPKDAATTYPILLARTPYGCWPYGEAIADPIMYNPDLVESGYIFVYQDLRSRSMSDGDPHFENLKPVYSSTDPNAVDEVTDTRDTIDWLVANVPNHNGSVGMFGSSYLGYTSLMGAVSAHPNLKAVLGAAPSVDIWYEDFNRNGLFTLAYTPILDWFGTPKFRRHEGPWWENNLSYWADGKRFGLAKDSYDFYLQKGPLGNFGDLIPESNYFWKEIIAHPNYDEHRQKRNALQYLHGIECPVLIVGGWNDEQNLYGIVNSYRTIRKQNPECDCRVVIGPWAHSEHKKRVGKNCVGDIFFGDGLVKDYQSKTEFAFFEHHLKAKPAFGIARATVFDTGSRKWLEFDDLAGESNQSLDWFPADDELLTLVQNEALSEPVEYVSDPNKPVPYLTTDEFQLFPAKSFMTSDQRHASKRPDVLTFVSKPLKKDLFLFGPIDASLRFSTSESDADLIVKLIDVLPMDRTPKPTDIDGVKMNGYQQLVRCGQIRGRFRESYSAPKPFVSGKVTDVKVSLLDVCHTFKAKHRIMVQVQSSLFPMFDRNPQKYVDNIYHAVDADFRKATHRIWPGSKITLSLGEAR